VWASNDVGQNVGFLLKGLNPSLAGVFPLYKKKMNPNNLHYKIKKLQKVKFCKKKK